MKKMLLLIMLSLPGLLACSSSNKQIETLDDITWASTPDSDDFVYNFYWFLPKQKAEKPKSSRLLELIAAPPVSVQTVSNENKLRLEELAVSKLKTRLKQNERCKAGYEILQTRWFDRSIRLTGRCSK